MHIPALIWLEDYHRYPALTIGETAKKLGRLHVLTKSVPVSFCLPISTLQIIANTNNLKLKVTTLVKSANLADPVEQLRVTKKLISLFHDLVIPHGLTQEIVNSYHRDLKNSLVMIFPSTHRGFLATSHLALGEANVIESLLTVWRELVIAQLQHHQNHQAVHEILFASPLVVERIPHATASGKAHSQVTGSGQRGVVMIESRWGENGQRAPFKDTFLVDIRTDTILKHTVGIQKQVRKRAGETITTSPLAMDKIKIPSLSDSQVVRLAQLTFALKQQQLDHLTLHWVLEDDQLFVTRITELEDLSETKLQTPQQTITKVYISVNNGSQAAELVTPQIDGVGILRSEFTLAQTGLHPAHVAQSHQKDSLVHALADTISAYQNQLHGRPLVYRFQNFTSDQLHKLKYANDYEPTETNPYLGFRGGMRMTTQPAIFQLELAAIKQALKKSTQPLTLLIPFVRNPQELHHIIKDVQAAAGTEFPHCNIWLQLNTPENVLNLSNYLHPKIAGISVNLKSLNGLLAGYDPDSEQLQDRYQLSPELVLPLLHQSLRTLRATSKTQLLDHRTQFIIHMEDYSSTFLQSLVTMGIDGVVVKPAVAPLAKACIIECEAARLADSYR